jgi:dTDP-4-amino-4,6-dideoxygalactose transaminase
MCAGVRPGDKVLMPAFTFTAVPSSIVNAGGVPVLVECRSDYCIDATDLKKKITKETRVLLLSYMRGHIPDMDQIVKICDDHGIFLIEDCAHSLGARWRGVLTGRLGKTACYSFQSYKVINAGEGGMLVSDDEEIIAKAILYSGSYEGLWNRHFVESQHLPELQTRIPTYNVRMSNVTAAIVRPQVPLVEEKAHKYNEHYDALSDQLSECHYIDVPKTDPRASIVPDSMQFNLQELTDEEVERFCDLLDLEGIKISVFGIDENNARCFWNWKYLDYKMEQLPKTWKMLNRACDLRLPISLDMEDIRVIGDTILRVIDYVVSQRRHEGYWRHDPRSGSLHQPKTISWV